MRVFAPLFPDITIAFNTSNKCVIKQIAININYVITLLNMVVNL